jgi:release factor glutamine methyltransferase
MLVSTQRAEPFAGRVLDVGTGSGVIALSLAGAWPEARVDAVDLSPAALALAAENAERLGLKERVQFHEGDLLAGLAGEYQLIVANLPYIATREMRELSREVLADPHTALEGGEKGTEVIERLIIQATNHLRGKLALEIGLGQAEPLAAFLREYHYSDIQVTPDYHGVSRFVFATYG